jgi:general secretion pathway protein E
VGEIMDMPYTVHKAVGCLECRQTGYRGRSGVYELMAIDSSIQAGIVDNPELPTLRQLAVKAGMRPLRQAGAEKIAAGVTTIDEVLSLTPEPQE